ncbi:hypothetical protein A0256_01185 [Mucilaginibacter sp. PAMC 26640]|nr:hypothetical protein A0256_01185 [Mucilaginibacter sp. PAMC 26640]
MQCYAVSDNDTELNLTEMNLTSDKKSKDLALLAFQNPDPLFCISLRGVIIMRNPAAKELEFVTYNGRTSTIESFWVNFSEEKNYTSDHFSFEIEANGRVFAFICRSIPNEDYFNAYGRDITQSKKNEEQLIRLSLVASANENGVIFNDSKGKILWSNDSFCKLTGYNLEEVIGKSTLDFCRGPLTDDHVINKISEAIGVTDSFDKELIHYRKDGSWFVARVRGQSYKTDTGDMQYFAIVEDISWEKKREEQLKVLSQIAENNINAVIITDNRGVITWVNKSFTKMTGYEPGEAIGLKPGHLLQGAGTDKTTVKYLKNQISKSLPFQTDIFNYTKSGKGYWLRIQGQPIRNDNDEVVAFFAVEENITREKEIQNLIKQSEDRFKLALEKIGDNVWEHNFHTGKTQFYKSTDELWGYDASNTVDGMGWWISVHKDDLPLLKHNYEQYKAGAISSHNLEYRILDKNGSIKWVLDKGIVLERTEDGQPLKTIGTHTDITSIKQTEIELAQRVKQFKSLSENIPGVVYEYEFKKDGTEGFNYISPAIERIFGITPDRFADYLQFIHPDDRERIIKKNAHCRQTLEPFYDEAILYVPGQKPRWHSVHSSFSYVSQSGSTVFTGFINDITERKNTENALRANEEKYRSIIANMNLGLLEVDNEGKVTYANQSFCNMSGYTQAELTGADASKLLLAEKSAEIIDQKKEIRKSGVADAYQLEANDKFGNKRWWLVSGAPRYNDKGELVGSIGIHLDITDQKIQEVELVAARTKAEQLAQAKDSFLANMSHEIRTPMNAIMGMSNQLAKTQLLPQQHFYLNTILSASENLLVIINDILDLSKIEAGKLSFENIGFQLSDIVNNVKQVITHKAEEKGIILHTDAIDSGIEKVLIGDPYRINQILLNLMTNAVKFTDQGSVTLSCKLVSDKSESQLISIEITDTGIGMDESFVKVLFDKFSQEYESVTRQYGGTGLGMSICKELVELMDGEITATSTKGIGTNIKVMIHFKKGTMADLPEKVTSKFDHKLLSGKKILVTDDNELNRLVATIIMQNYGATVLSAENGEEALAVIDEHQPDMVLMDIQMPVLNGFETTKQLREKNTPIPIIALTAAAIKGERDRCIEAGMNDYITKPFREEEFLKTISKWINAPIEKTAGYIQLNEQPLYELTKLKEISRGNEVFVKRMVDIFCTQTPLLVKDMVSAYQDGKMDQMAAAAHQLKPSVENLNIHDLKRIVKSIEDIGNHRVENTGLHKLLENAEDLVEQVVAKMKQEYPD